MTDGDEFYSLNAADESDESSDEQEKPLVLPARTLRNRRTLKRPRRLNDYVIDEQIDYAADKALLMQVLGSDELGEIDLSVVKALQNKNWS